MIRNTCRGKQSEIYSPRLSCYKRGRGGLVINLLRAVLPTFGEVKLRRSIIVTKNPIYGGSGGLLFFEF